MKILPIKRVLHEETEGYFDPTPFLGGWVEPTAEVVWETCFGTVTAYRHGEGILWIVPEAIPEGLGFNFQLNNIVDIHHELQRVHDQQMRKFLSSQTSQSDTLSAVFDYTAQGMVRREGGGVGIDAETLREARERLIQEIAEMRMKTMLNPRVEIQRHRMIDKMSAVGMTEVKAPTPMCRDFKKTSEWLDDLKKGGKVLGMLGLPEA